VGGLLTAALVRMSPGFESDERLLDARLDSASQAAVRAEHAANHNVLLFYARHVAGISSSKGVLRARCRAERTP
jgi:hypothetical protein